METRQYPDAQYPFLRYQIGEMTTRPEELPIYERNPDGTSSRRITRYYKGTNRISVFLLRAFGSTKEEAHAMLG